MGPEKRQLMARICSAPSIYEARFSLGGSNPILSDCKFVFAARAGALPGIAVDRNFGGTGVICSLFNTGRVFVLDRLTVADMEREGQASYPVDYSISLDTMTLSYLEPYFGGRSVPSDFEEVFAFLARDDVNVDPLPYVWENLFNLSGSENASSIFTRLRAYEVLRTLDLTAIRSGAGIRSRLSDAELNKHAQEHVAKMHRKAEPESAFIDTLRFRHQFLHAMLLKMAILQLEKPRAPITTKLNSFLDFCASDLATIAVREIAIARAYFERGQSLAFFGKIQRGQQRLFQELRGMAWDLLHVRHMEEAMTCRPDPAARYFFPAILTFDRRLTEIIGLCRLSACAFIEDGAEIMPFFDTDLLSLFSDDPDQQNGIYERHYSNDAIACRDSPQS